MTAASATSTKVLHTMAPFHRRVSDALSAPLSVATLSAPSPMRSFLMRAMRFTLATAGIVIVALVVVLPSIQPSLNRVRVHGALPVIDFGDRKDAMMDARYSGIDNLGRPFAIDADLVRNVANDTLPMDLSAPHGELTMPSGATVNLRADDGVYNRVGELVDLSGNVVLKHSSGYEMESTTARIDLAASAAAGDEPTTARGPLGQVRSEGFRIRDGGEVVVFTGRARMRIQPGAFPEVQ